MLFIIVAGMVGLLAIMAFLVQGPPYVPSDDTSAEVLIKEITSHHPTRVLDMGSGDGKLVILLARQGLRVDGVELNPLLVFRSRRAIRKAQLTAEAHIYWGNFWKFDVSRYDIVTLYAIPHIMARLENKLVTELAPGSRVVSNYFTFPSLQPSVNKDRLKVYKI